MAVSLRVRIICNLLAKEILKFLISKRIEAIPDKVAQWFREKKDLSELIPANVNIPSKYKGIIIKSAFKEVSENPEVARATYDLILQNVHDMAALAKQELNALGNREGAENMRRVQVIAAFLGSDKVKSWYYKNMDSALRKIGDQLAGPESSCKEENKERTEGTVEEKRDKTEGTILKTDQISNSASCI